MGMQLKSSKYLLGVLLILVSFSVVYASSSSRIFRIKDIIIEEDIFFEGDIVEGTIFIENRRNKTYQYQLELIYNNKIFKQGNPRFIHPYQTAEQDFFLELPEKDNVWVSFRVYNEEFSVSQRKNFLISSRKRDFTFSLDRDIETLSPGDKETFNVKLYNRGTLDDIYTISIENWHHFEIEDKTIKIDYFNSEEMSFDIEIPEDIRVGKYNIEVQICNIEDKCKTRDLMLHINRPEREQSIIIFEEEERQKKFSRIEEPIELSFSAQNIGAEEKRYTVFIEKNETEEEILINIENPEFELNVDESKNTSFTLTPMDRTDYVVYLAINSNGNRIYREKTELNYETRIGALSGMFFVNVDNGTSGIGLLITSLLGIGIASYIIFRYLQKNIWKEKVVDYTEKHPRKLTNNLDMEAYKNG